MGPTAAPDESTHCQSYRLGVPHDVAMYRREPPDHAVTLGEPNVHITEPSFTSSMAVAIGAGSQWPQWRATATRDGSPCQRRQSVVANEVGVNGLGSMGTAIEDLLHVEATDRRVWDGIELVGKDLGLELVAELDRVEALEHHLGVDEPIIHVRLHRKISWLNVELRCNRELQDPLLGKCRRLAALVALAVRLAVALARSEPGVTLASRRRPSTESCLKSACILARRTLHPVGALVGK